MLMFREGVSLRIYSKCGKMRTRIIPNTNTFHAALVYRMENERKISKGVKLSNFLEVMKGT